MNYFCFQWHITEKCDQCCKHCYIFGSNYEYSPEPNLHQISQIIDKCVDMCSELNVIPTFDITGGDPLLCSNFWELANILYNKKIKFSILGNPFHLNLRVCEKLHKMGCMSYQMSIDGVEETHDLIRKHGSYNKTFEVIPLLKNAGIRTAIMTTVSSANIKEVPNIIDEVVSNNIDVFAFARYCPTEERDKLNIVSPYEYRELLDKCWKKFQQYKNSNTLFNLKDHLWTLYLYEEGYFKLNPKISDTIYEGCSCGIGHMTILTDGTLYACRRCNSPIGNIYKDSLYHVFNTVLDEYRKYDKFQKCSKCELLQYCRGCPAVAQSVFGNFYDPDPQCWK